MNEPYAKMKFGTDTATMAIFDPAAISHRSSDDADWWSIPADEVHEINEGNVLFVNLGCDGGYEVEVYRHEEKARNHSKPIKANLKIISGCLYIGAGEQVPAGDFGPETTYGGVLVTAERGTNEIWVYMPKLGKIIVEFKHSNNEPRNSFIESPRF